MASPIITAPPILVATSYADFSSQNSHLVGSFIGPRLVPGGRSRYAGLTAIGSLPPAFAVFKSSNGGKAGTWSPAPLDAAHSPALISFPLYEVGATATGYDYCWIGDGGDAPSEGIGYAKFSTLTDTWGTVATAPGNTVSGSGQLAVGRRSNGDIVVVFRSQTPLDGNLQWGFFHAGVWNGPFDFNTTSTNLQARAVLIGPDDTVHVILVDGVSFATGQGDIYYQNISPLNVVSAPTFIVTLGMGTPDSFLSGLPIVLTSEDQILFPFSDNASTHTAMFIGQGIAAPPVWSQISLETGLPAGAPYAYPISQLPPVGPLRIFETLQGPGSALQIWFTPWDGTSLGTPVLFYDANLDPPPGGPPGDLLKISVSQFSPIEGLVAMVPAGGGFPPENTYFLSTCPTNAQGV